MKRITTTDLKNAGITKVDLDPEFQQKLIDNTFAALRKFSSSKKTRAVHKILDNNLIIPAIFSGNAAEYLISPKMKGNVLRMLMFNLYFFDDSLDAAGAVGYATKLEILHKSMQKEKTFLSDKQIYNLEQLNKDKEEVSENLLKSLDYIKLVDGIYFGWLLVLSNSALEKDSFSESKIVTTAADILADILKKMYLKINSKIEPEVHQLLEAIAIYFIRIYFYGESAQYVLNKMERAFNEETLDAIKKTKVTRFAQFNDLSIIMKEAQLMPMTPNTFDLQMQKMFGKYGYEYYIQNSMMNFIAFMANLAHPSQIFKDAYEVDDDAHERLEQLLLNQQKFIKLDSHDI